MTLSPETAKTKLCVLSTPRPGPQQPCCGDACMAYWRWADVAKSVGYCAKGGKPEF